MATQSLNDLARLINQQIEFQEPLGENITKAKVLLDVALECELLQYPPDALYYYFWAISDFLEKATEIQKQSLDNLIRHQRLNSSGEQI